MPDKTTHFQKNKMSKIKTKVLFALAKEPTPRSETLSCASKRAGFLSSLCS